ncbi:MAG: hypothetical protein AAF585_25935, partial [Verrucomicrobiota bacterium]
RSATCHTTAATRGQENALLALPHALSRYGEVKKLCTCEAVGDGEGHWRLECHCENWPSWGKIIQKRPVRRAIAKEAQKMEVV